MLPLTGGISQFVLQADHHAVGLHVRHMSKDYMNICAVFMLKIWILKNQCIPHKWIVLFAHADCLAQKWSASTINLQEAEETKIHTNNFFPDYIRWFGNEYFALV